MINLASLSSALPQICNKWQIILYHKLHWGGRQGGQNLYWGRPPSWPPFEPPLVVIVVVRARVITVSSSGETILVIVWQSFSDVAVAPAMRFVNGCSAAPSDETTVDT